ncbi:MAG: hypothetical protein IJF76_04225 [Clostridia bacterium]|nr:hypothetical protein [Clostridia bacterium]
MDELLKLFSGINGANSGNMSELLPLFAKLMSQTQEKKSVELTTLDLSKALFELCEDGQLNNSSAREN